MTTTSQRDETATRPGALTTTTTTPTTTPPVPNATNATNATNGSTPAAEANRRFWREQLLAGSRTVVPRWSLDPVARVSQQETVMRSDLTAALQRVAHELAVPFGSVVLAAHVRALAALSGEADVVTGYVAAPDGEPWPCRITTDAPTWRALLGEVQRCVSEVLAHQDFPIDDLRAELNLEEPAYEVVFDPTGFGPVGCLPVGDDHHLVGDAVLWVGLRRSGDQHVLRLRYRADLLDATAAARMLGYHLTALKQLATDPDADPRQQTLLSAEEARLQLDGLAGPHRELPDRRAHELFEARVRSHPDAVAAQHGTRRWTYAELNSHANRLARALQTHGLQPEDVVAVVTERNLDWLASVLAVFKAGGVYLPIEPHFPADRIAATLSRAGCRLALTEAGSSSGLDQALGTVSGVRRLEVRSAYDEGHPDHDLGIAVAADQLAYIYFTSGSTGEPKGAMCEHAGMLNHLFAKIDDLEIGEDSVVAQIAPQCFDISLWQLVSALLVGGRTVVFEQEVILDVRRFIDQIVDREVTVLQVVPSYLEVVLSYLEQDSRQLPDLRYVSATGEALKRELTQRWFATVPKAKLVNAYGLTETSDDTNHEVMDQVPIRDRVPLGRCINNVHVYVVDEQLRLVPLGAPGLIAFSGVCVGRGYVNDPERTREAYRTDPYRPDRRLYLGGDYGRWLPEGKLEFLGRRDSQVKIAGFRIEIGEIENKLLQVPGVRDGAVVVCEDVGRSRRLVAFYTSHDPLPVELLRRRLGESLPDYMIPSGFHRQDSLPLTANGKIDRKSLTALAGQLAPGQHDEAPSTPTERWLADAWAVALGTSPDRVGRRDHFFDSGGTSLAAVRLAIALDRRVSLKDLTRHPVLADLAALIDGRSPAPSGLLQSLTGPVPRAESGAAGGGAAAGAAAGGAPDTALVCFPYAGGNAVNFQQMARALRDTALAVYAVELPGHDLAAERESFAPLDHVVEQVVAEIGRHGHSRILLWGHSSGSAFALATAHALARHGIGVERVFLAAQLIADATTRRAAAAELTAASNGDLATLLATDGGYAELGELDAQRAEHIGAAYRHDGVCAHDYLAGILESPPRQKLPAPITVVVAADDPSTAGYQNRYLDWSLAAEEIDLYELPDGGHYFLRSRPVEAAQAVAQAADVVNPSRLTS